VSSLFDFDRSAERLPVSLITGFLGSGKTTLLNRLLRRPDMADSAVIINEFGEIPLDHLLVEPITGEAIVLSSGCVCCAVRGDLQDALRRLLVQRDRNEVPTFSRVLIETSGLADPAPVVQLFLNNPLLGHDLRLDTVVAMVDGALGATQLLGYPECLKQAAIADRLLVTKTDIAEAMAVEALTQTLRAINPGASIDTVVDGECDPAKLFGAGLFERRDPARWLNDRAYTAAPAPAHDHRHAPGIGSFSLVAEQPLDWLAFHRWLGDLRATHGDRLLRIKGVLNIANEDGPVVIHGVQHIFHPPIALRQWPDGDRRSRLVMIVRDLDRGPIEAGWSGLSAQVHNPP
jgi:G3E family GTPase